MIGRLRRKYLGGNLEHDRFFDELRRERARTRLREAVLESLGSGSGGQADEAFFAQLTRISPGHDDP